MAPVELHLNVEDSPTRILEGLNEVVTETLVAGSVTVNEADANVLKSLLQIINASAFDVGDTVIEPELCVRGMGVIPIPPI